MQALFQSTHSLSAMTEPDTTHDYSTGEPRRHHNLYLEDGNLVLQVKIFLFFPSKHTNTIVLKRWRKASLKFIGRFSQDILQL